MCLGDLISMSAGSWGRLGNFRVCFYSLTVVIAYLLAFYLILQSWSFPLSNFIVCQGLGYASRQECSLSEWSSMYHLRAHLLKLSLLPVDWLTCSPLGNDVMSYGGKSPANRIWLWLQGRGHFYFFPHLLVRFLTLCIKCVTVNRDIERLLVISMPHDVSSVCW